jgi:16S rRNA (guanine1207-N2)-methyltransferase
MPRIHKSLDFMLEDESPANIHFDLIYRSDSKIFQSDDALFVDYDLTKISVLQPRHWKCCELEDLSKTFKNILIKISQFDSLKQVKRDIYAAGRLLESGGELRITVPPKSGAKRIASDLSEVFNSIKVVKSASKALFICHNAAPKEFAEESLQINHFDSISGKTLDFTVRPGIFSSAKIDAGTQLLLNSIEPLEGKKLLDVGCGYGAIGVTSAARGAFVTLLDVDARVIKIAGHNLRLNNLDGTVLLKLQPYDFEAEIFDVVLSNPPTHSGSDTLRVLFKEIFRVCRTDGYIAIVIREQLNYEKWLQELGSVVKIGAADGYKVLQIKKA